MTNLRTEKEDWFTDALVGSGRAFISGIPLSQSLPSEIVTLRVFGHWPRDGEFSMEGGLPNFYYLMLGMVSIEVNKGTDVENFIMTPALIAISIRLARLLITRVDIIIFSKSLDEYGKLLPFKIFRRCGGNGVMISASDYASELNLLRNNVRQDEDLPAPKIKMINKSQNDNLKAWTSMFLSSRFAINDIDAILILDSSGQPNRIFLESKRSNNELLPNWLPKIKDSPNYRLMQSITMNNPDIIDFTCAYTLNDVGSISVFTLKQVTRSQLSGVRYEIKAVTGERAVQELINLLSNLVNRSTAITGTEWNSTR